MATTRVPHRGVLVTVLVFVGVFSLGLSLAGITGPFPLPAWLSGGASGPADALAPSEPVRVAIPTVGVDAQVHRVGLADDGAIEAPPMRRAHEAGWYEDGPTPGQHGAAVIVGHVDNEDGPAVFAQVASLSAGDRVEVARRDRSDAVFEVTEVRRYDKNALPPEEVYGDFSAPELRLITCGGQWAGGEVGYAENVIVFATLTQGPDQAARRRNSSQRGSGGGLYPSTRHAGPRGTDGTVCSRQPSSPGVQSPLR